MNYLDTIMHLYNFTRGVATPEVQSHIKWQRVNQVFLEPITWDDKDLPTYTMLVGLENNHVTYIVPLVGLTKNNLRLRGCIVEQFLKRNLIINDVIYYGYDDSTNRVCLLAKQHIASDLETNIGFYIKIRGAIEYELMRFDNFLRDLQTNCLDD